MDRTGTGLALDQRARQVIWDVYVEYEYFKDPYYDYIDLPLRALKLMGSYPDYEHYDHVFIDEAQDLSIAEMEVALKLCKEPRGKVRRSSCQTVMK